MPTIPISDETHTRLIEFKQVVEAVIEKEVSFEDYVEKIMSQGIDSILEMLIGSLDQRIMVKSLQQLGSRHPAQVYQYITDMLKQGAMVQEREEAKRRMGFHTSAKTE
jgi:hypothetical protein